MAEEKNAPRPIDSEVRALLERHSGRYSEEKFWKKIWRWAKRAGKAVIKHALILYYAAQDEDTPQWVRTLIRGALAYFIVPFDVVPDPIPGGGFLDDLAVLLLLIGQIADYIKPEHHHRACERMKEWFGKEER